MDSFCQPLAVPSSETHREAAQCNQTFKRNDTLQRDQHLRSNAHTPTLFAAWKLVSVEKGCPGGIRTTTSPNRLGVHRSKIFQILIFSEGTKPPNFQEISLQHLKFPEEFRENFESSVILIFSFLSTEARRTILNSHVGGFVLCNEYA